MAGRSRLAACMLVLALAGCGSGATDGPAAEESSLPTPSPSASSSAAPLVDVPSPADVVDDADARLVDVAAAPGGPGVRAAVWSTCPAPDCSARHVAVAVTTDDSTSRVVVDRVWPSVPAVAVDGEGNAVVTSYGRRVELTLVRPDGTTTDVRRSREEAPVDPGEIVAGVEHSARGTSFYATRPADATGHPVPVPPDTQVLRQLPSGQLRAITRQRTYAWSDDGGATWAESAGASEGALLQSFVTSAPDVHVLVAGGDGATLFPFGEIRRLGGMGTWSVTPLPRTPRAYIGATAVLPDGRFLADVDAWSDNRRQGGRLRGTPPGLYVSDGDDWASYAPLELGAPFTGTAHHLPDVRQVDVTGARTSIGAIGPDGRSWWTSTDLGATWTEQRAR